MAQRQGLAWRAAICLAGMLVVSAAHAAGSPFDSGVAAYERSDYAEARRQWERALQAGDWDAARSLGHLYRRGLGVARDPGRAADYYRQAFAHGVVNAGLNLAELYMAGDGVPHDPGQAMALLRQAADQGSEMAEFRLHDIEAAERPRPPLVAVPLGRSPADRADDDVAPAASPAQHKLRLASYRSRDGAQRGWRQFERPDLAPLVEEADAPGLGRVFRLYAVGSDDALAGLCGELTAQGRRCQFH